MNSKDRKLFGKIIFQGAVELLTGMHIGASKETVDIGGLDQPVIKHPITEEPYIPGSSIKGKLRSLLEMKLHTEGKIDFNRSMKQGAAIMIHVCDDWDEAKECQVCRLFGSSAKSSDQANFPSRIKIRDAEFTEYSRNFIMKETELKWENALDRITAASNPRQIERVPAGAEFEFGFIYNVEDINQLKEDLINLLSSVELLEDDSLGGHGSRGYGKVRFHFSEVIAKSVDFYFGDESKKRELIKESWEREKPVKEQKFKTASEVKDIVCEKLDELKKIFIEEAK